MELAPAQLSCLFGLQEALGESTHPCIQIRECAGPSGRPWPGWTACTC